MNSLARVLVLSILSVDVVQLSWARHFSFVHGQAFTYGVDRVFFRLLAHRVLEARCLLAETAPALLADFLGFFSPDRGHARLGGIGLLRNW